MTAAPKVAVVTGAASGIGFAMTMRCLELGMQVVALDLDAEGLQRLPSGPALKTLQCDVTQENSLRGAAREAGQTFGQIQILINNAGVFGEGGAGDLDLDRFRWVLDVNLISMVTGVEVFLPQLLANSGNAYILNTASVAGHIGFANLLAYSASKHAVVGYSESLAEQLVDKVSVSVLCPGFVNTRIADTGRYEQGNENNTELAQSVGEGMAPETVAAFAIDRTLAGDRFIFTHPGTYGEVVERYSEIDRAFERTRVDERVMADPDASRMASRVDTEGLHK